MKFEPSDALFKDPYHFLDLGLGAGSDIIEFPEQNYYLTDLDDAKAVLANKDENYHPHSDFFFTSRGLLQPRSRQVDMARGAVKFLQQHLNATRQLLPERVKEQLQGRHSWPDISNLFMFLLFEPALLDARGDKPLKNCLDEIVHRSVLSGKRLEHGGWRRWLYRQRNYRLLKKEIRARRRGRVECQDVMSALVGAADHGISDTELADIFLSFLFATTGSLGFCLSWCLHLVSEAPEKAKLPSQWLVLEALRLWPVAWNLARMPAKDHQLPSGHKVSNNSVVIACPYSVQRNPKHWPDADRFLPERWQDNSNRQRLLAFGWGEHKCVASNLTLELVSELLDIILGNYHLSCEYSGERPLAQAALAPPSFTLTLSAKTEQNHAQLA